MTRKHTSAMQNTSSGNLSAGYANVVYKTMTNTLETSSLATLHSAVVTNDLHASNLYTASGMQNRVLYPASKFVRTEDISTAPAGDYGLICTGIQAYGTTMHVVIHGSVTCSTPSGQVSSGYINYSPYLQTASGSRVYSTSPMIKKASSAQNALNWSALAACGDFNNLTPSAVYSVGLTAHYVSDNSMTFTTSYSSMCCVHAS